MKTHQKKHQAGFTLIEYIVVLVVASIIAAMVYAYFGSALTQSGVPIARLQQVSNLQRVMESIVADYERLNQINMRFKWRSSQPYTLGEVVLPSTSANNVTSTIDPNASRYYVCTTAGTSGSALPSSWPVTTNPGLTTGGTLPDGTAVWTELGYVWKSSTNYPADAIIVPPKNNGHFYKGPSSASTSGGTAPTAWPTAPNSTVSDGLVTWTEAGTILDNSDATVEDLYTYLTTQPSRYGTGYALVTAETKFIKFSGTSPAETDLVSGDEKNILKVTIKNANTAETLTEFFTIR